MHDLFSLLGVVDLEGQEMSWSSKLEFPDTVLVLLDGDSVSSGEVVSFSLLFFTNVIIFSIFVVSHDADEFLQVLDFSWLNKHDEFNEFKHLPF